jgi:oligosaccharide repeat unit polymerase
MNRTPRALAVMIVIATITLAITAVTYPWLCAWLLLCGTFVTAWFVSWHTSRDPFAPLLPVTGYIFLGIGVRGIAVREGWLPDNYNLPLGSQWLTVFVWLLGTLAIVSCCLGYRSRTGVLIGRRPSSGKLVGRHIPKEILVSFSIICVLIGVLSLVLLRHRFAGVAGFGQTPAAVASRTSEGGLFGIDMLAYFPLLGALLTWRVRGIGVTGRIALIANLILVISWFLIAGRKSLLFEAILAFFVVRHYSCKRIRGRTLAVLIIPALFIISLSFYFKDYGFKTQSIEAQYSGRPAWEAVVDPLISRSYQFDALTMIVDKTRSAEDYRLGSTFEDVLWFYVPRQLWPTKPVSFGYSFGPEFFPGSNATLSYTPSMVGELYLNFGLIGVVGGFYLFGIVLRACYESFSGSRSRLSVAMYAIILFRLTNMVEGPISTHFEFLLAELTPIAVLIVANGVLTRAAGAPPPRPGGSSATRARAGVARAAYRKVR